MNRVTGVAGRTAVVLGVLGVAGTARAQTYGPYTFAADSWSTAATFTGTAGCAGGSAYPSGSCNDNVVGHSPAVCAANLNNSTPGSTGTPVGAVCSSTEYAELTFGARAITNVVGPDVIVFDSRFSIDGAAVSVETAPGVFSPFLVWMPDAQFALVRLPGSSIRVRARDRNIRAPSGLEKVCAALLRAPSPSGRTSAIAS